MSELIDHYRDRFGSADGVRIVRAPGRVNLIGEHTDYNGGFVLPMALDMAVRIALTPLDEPRVVLASTQFDGTAEFALGEAPEDLPHWARYPARVAEVLAEEGIETGGFRGVVEGDVPVGAGLSSSAAYEVAAALALLLAARPEADPGSAAELAEAAGTTTARLAELCQAAEHRVGVRCGIMDQFISLHGESAHAVLLDCRDLSHRAVPLPAGEAKVVVIDSAVRRKLTSGAYNERRSQCEEGVRLLKEIDPSIEQLRDVDPDFLAEHADRLPETVRRRCRHVVTEIARTRESAEVLARGDVARFGELMNDSHHSLRDDYEVSGPELDLLVELAHGTSGVLGARLTGAGFGGCTVNLCRPGAVEPLAEAVRTEYARRTELEPRVWVTEPAAGAQVEV